MKISSFKIYEVKPRWIFIKIITDEGIEGWGEMISGAKTETVTACANEMCKKLLGRDPFDIEALWQELYRSFFRGGPVNMTVISGIETALWDIKGKYYNMPVYEFLGGKVRDKLKVYSWIGGDRPNNVAEEAKQRFDQGFTAVKMNATEELHYIDSYEKVDQVLERMNSIKELLGNKIQVGIDFHGRVHKPMAKILIKELEPFRPMFIEEPVLPENWDAIIDTAKNSPIPIATGERLSTRWEFKRLFNNNSVDIIQPDVALAGGILETRKIAAAAEMYDIAVAPHAPYGPIALAATLQLDMCTPNVFIQEQSLGIHYNKGFDLIDFVKNKEIFMFKDGYLDVPEKPGLGIEIDEELVKKVSAEGLVWTNPKWKNYDGTIAEW
ncbi:MAG: galactonate dehydratase [Sebaldella sp.]|nr:galactonate dehydratase [Sebaldella sp.]